MYLCDYDLSGRVAVVSGSTEGIGLETARLLHAAGAAVMINGRRREQGQTALQSLGGLGERLSYAEADVTKPDGARALVSAAVAQFGRLDIVVGSGEPKWPPAALFTETPVEHLPHYFESYVLSKAYLFHAAVPVMRSQAYGKLVAITTDAGRVPTPAETMVGSAAAALLFLTRSLGREVSRWGIRVNAVATTLTRDTPFWDKFAESHESDEPIWKAFRKLERITPFGINRAADVARTAFFFCCPTSDQISGATISINGGLSFPG